MSETGLLYTTPKPTAFSDLQDVHDLSIYHPESLSGEGPNCEAGEGTASDKETRGDGTVNKDKRTKSVPGDLHFGCRR